jgi:hypothetical protein
MLIRTTIVVTAVADQLIFRVLTAISNMAASIIGRTVIAIIDSVIGFKLKLKCNPFERGNVNK